MAWLADENCTSRTYVMYTPCSRTVCFCVTLHTAVLCVFLFNFTLYTHTCTHTVYRTSTSEARYIYIYQVVGKVTLKVHPVSTVATGHACTYQNTHLLAESCRLAGRALIIVLTHRTSHTHAAATNAGRRACHTCSRTDDWKWQR